MIDILRHFAEGLGVPPNNFNQCTHLYEVGFTLNDPQSCGSCLENKELRYKKCNQVVLHVDVNDRTSIYAVSWDTILKTLNNRNKEGQRCDYVLCGEDKIVFCELTCTEASKMDPFVNSSGKQRGKRATARDQIKETIELMGMHPVLWENILIKQKKEGIVAWRDSSANESVTIDNKAARNMKVFTDTPSNSQPKIIFEEKICGVVFQILQVKYPNHYVWN